jgi:hypothetical protein
MTLRGPELASRMHAHVRQIRHFGVGVHGLCVHAAEEIGRV